MRERLILLIGGRSTEHDASIHSYRSVIEALDRMATSFSLDMVVYVGRDGAPFVHDAAPWPREERELARGRATSLGALIDLLIDLSRARDAFVFNLLHGNEGEDGAWQGIAEVAELRGTFGSVFASALTMNKWVQSLVAVELMPMSLRMPDTWRITPAMTDHDLDAIVDALGGALCVVKPNRMGASHFAERFTPSRPLLREAFRRIAPFDDEVLVQRYIEGIEYTCGCLAHNGDVLALPIIRAFTKHAFLGHAEKHKSGMVTVDLVLDDDDTSRKVKEISRALFRAFDILHMCRFDYIVDNAGTVWFLEANSIPGLMGGSAFPKMLSAAGLDLIDLIAAGIDAAARHTRREKLLLYEIED